MDTEIWKLLKGLPLPIFAIIILAVALWKPENIKLWVSWIFYFLSNSLIKTFRRKAVANGIESRCTSAIQKLAKESPDLNLPDLYIKWANEDNIQSFLKEGKAIVKLNFTINHSKNIVTATSEYVKTVILARTKPYIDKTLRSAIDFSLTKRILLSIRKYQKEYVSLFLNDNPISDPIVKQKCSTLEEIDETGLLTRIVLKELDEFGDKLAGRLPQELYNIEANKFINFIHSIATREPDEQTNLLFENQHINIAIILVAKEETFINHGIDAYLRRIKLSLSKGLQNFYLLARNDKVEILKQIATQLLETGYFIQQHKPQEYRDILKRDVICYYFKINKDSLISKAAQNISHAKNENIILTGIITKVSQDYIKVNVDGLEGIIYKENISTIPIDNIKNYFQIDELIELKVLKTLEDGTTEFVTKETKSDPNILLREQLSIGKQVEGTIRYVDDDFLIVDLNDYKVDGVAFRNNLTPSKYVFLHQKFQMGDIYYFKIIGYDFIKGRVKLEINDLIDPWSSFAFKDDEIVKFTVTKRISKGYVGEIREGVEAILYDNELTWFSNEIDKEKSKIKLSGILECKISRIEREKRIVILSRKTSQNPIENYFNSNSGTIVEFVANDISDYGISGYIENKWKVYVPKYLQSWNNSNYNYKVGRKYKVFIKGIHNSKEKIIGSFREFLKHPLSQFAESFPEKSLVGKCNISSIHEWGFLVTITIEAKDFEAYLSKGELTDKGYINAVENIFRSGDKIPLIVKRIDFERCKISMSLKDVFILNSSRLQDLKYENSYKAIVVAANKGGNYVVFLKGIWLDGILETNNAYQIGEEIEVRPSRVDSQNLLLTDE